MDIHYKSFVPRSKQDHHFDQIIPALSSVSNKNFNFSCTKSPTNADYSNFPQKTPTQLSNNRKRVNVVTFTPDESNELVSHNPSATSVNIPSTYDGTVSDTGKTSASGNIPSILRTCRSSLSSKSDGALDQGVSLVDSASKLIAARRRAAKEIADTILNDEVQTKKFDGFQTSDITPKRAVSPEILRPEPQSSVYRRVGKSVSLLPPLQPTIDSSQMYTNKKPRVCYNPRLYQVGLEDEEAENQYLLQSQNIVYRSNSDPISRIVEEDQLYVFDETDNIDHSNCSIVRRTNLTKSNSEGSYNLNREVTHSNRMEATIDLNKERLAIVENVKEAHECQENGETEYLLDDFEYLIEGLKDNLPASTRIVSIITLTGKCLAKSYRELLKAHSLLTKIFRYLEDGYLNESVAMCTSALFLVLARDRQPRIFDDSSLALLLKLPRISKSHSRTHQAKQSKENERVRDKIRLMLNRLHQSNNDDRKNTDLETKSSGMKASCPRPCACCRHLKLDNNITTEDLVVECLLQFSTRKCADWFKSLLRKQHGLDLICDQITSSVEYLGSDLGPQSLDEFVMDRLHRLYNYMRFFEHMTFQNRDNQSYLVDYGDAILVETLLRCLKLCAANLSYQPSGSQEKKLIEACLLANLRLLANISHDNEYTSNLLGSHVGLLKLIFSCLLHLPRFMSTSKRFDLSVLALALLINLVEHCSDNRRRMAHVNISRKRVACLGKCGQISNNDCNTTVNNDNNISEKSMEFSFDDEVEDEDMDVEEDDDDDDPNHFVNVDCESSDTKINVLEALVKIFLRHDDRAKNNTLIEGEEEVLTENNDDGEINSDPKWRIVADRSVSHKNKSSLLLGPKRREKLTELSESEDDCSSEEGADVEFMISSKEEEEELQKKLSAAGQHMQDSVVSAYAALLLGYIIKSSSSYMERIREHLPLGKFKILAFVLAKFLSILSLTSGMGRSGEESILEIVRLLEAQDQVCVGLTVDGSASMSSRPLCLPQTRHSSLSPTSSFINMSQCQSVDECSVDDVLVSA